MNQNKLPVKHLAILLFLLAVAGVLFQVTSIKLVAVRRLEVEVTQLAEAQVKLSELQTTLPVISEEVLGWRKMLPATEADVAVFAVQVERSARSQGLVVNLDFDDFPKSLEIKGKNILGLGANITLDGSFTGLSNFLSVLSSQPYFFKIDKLTITQSQSHHGVKAILNGVLVMSERN